MPHIFIVRLIEHHHDVVRHPFHQRCHLRLGGHGARRIVGIADKEQPGLVGDGSRHGWQIVMPILLGHFHRHAVRRLHLHFINHEGMFGHHGLVSRREEGSGKESEDFIGAVSKYDLVRRNLPTFGQGSSQTERSAIWIPVQSRNRLGQYGHGFR